MEDARRPLLDVLSLSALECRTKVFSARTCVFVSNLLVLSLQEVAAVDGLYRIRVPRVSLQADRQAERQVEGYLTAFVRAVCPSHSALSAESGLKWGGNRRQGHDDQICITRRIARQSRAARAARSRETSKLTREQLRIE